MTDVSVYSFIADIVCVKAIYASLTWIEGDRWPCMESHNNLTTVLSSLVSSKRLGWM